MKRDRLAVLTFVLIFITLLYLVVQLARWAYSPAPAHHDKPISTLGLVPSVEIEPSTTTSTTEAPSTTTTEVLRTTTTRASRGTPRTSATEEMGDGFWERLAQCESEMGRTSSNIFQFSPDTAATVGIDGSEPYEVQRAAAIAWAARIHPNEGTSSGWPNCWWVALSQQG